MGSCASFHPDQAFQQVLGGAVLESGCVGSVLSCADGFVADLEQVTLLL